MKDIIARSFDFATVKGISQNQLLQHYDLYKGYVRNTNKIWNEIENINDFSDSNSTYSEIRSLMLGQSYAVNGTKLHELYFENICDNGRGVSGEILRKIKSDFITYDRWKRIFESVGMAMRGWVVLGIDSLDNKLHIYGLDAHDVGAILCGYPLLVLDVYEHAYMIDFGIDRKKYINVFFDNINWSIVNERYNKYKKIFVI